MLKVSTGLPSILIGSWQILKGCHRVLVELGEITLIFTCLFDFQWMPEDVKGYHGI